MMKGDDTRRAVTYITNYVPRPPKPPRVALNRLMFEINESSNETDLQQAICDEIRKHGKKADIRYIFAASNFDQKSENFQSEVVMDGWCQTSEPKDIMRNQLLDYHHKSPMLAIMERDAVDCLETLINLVPLATTKRLLHRSPLLRDHLSTRDIIAGFHGSLKFQLNLENIEVYHSFGELVIITECSINVLAALLFITGLELKATECLKYLLQLAPDLIHIMPMDLYLDVGKTIFCWNIMYGNIDMTEHLHDMGAPEGDLNVLWETVIYQQHCCNKQSVQYIKLVMRLSEGREEELSTYRMDDEDGDSLLHLMCREYAHLIWICRKDRKLLVSLIEMLIDSGLHPSDTNQKNENAMDILFRVAEPEEHRRDVRDDLPTFITILECLTRGYDVTFPHELQLADDAVLGNINAAVVVVKAMEMAINSDVPGNWDHILFKVGSILLCWTDYSESSSCILCRPIVSAFYSAMCKGKNLKDIPKSRRRIFQRVTNLKQKGRYADSMFELFNINCCTVPLVELLVHCGFNLRQSLKNGQLKFTLLCLLNDMSADSELPLLRFTKLSKMCWLYYPQARPVFKAVIQQALRRKYFDNVKKAAAKALSLHAQVRPLKLLTRLAIRQRVEFTDIEKLSQLPPLLRQYVRIGEMPSDHIIRDILAEKQHASPKNQTPASAPTEEDCPLSPPTKRPRLK